MGLCEILWITYKRGLAVCCENNTTDPSEKRRPETAHKWGNSAAKDAIGKTMMPHKNSRKNTRLNMLIIIITTSV
jgi:hypothetical protein